MKGESTSAAGANCRLVFSQKYVGADTRTSATVYSADSGCAIPTRRVNTA
jgi:hypothetical protein